ncbi:Alpha-2-HS-glycoprotein [Liparis tanakae]|uniref:Alpha-2-HS-glycoprotein n=1 Tax=Liparis tanakae TaxID=230148 RepID=A0A4Z2GNP1_9TELE|nr:Alpha-2-HS-glycoprotein [Liparis tanakae]
MRTDRRHTGELTPTSRQRNANRHICVSKMGKMDKSSQSSSLLREQKREMKFLGITLILGLLAGVWAQINVVRPQCDSPEAEEAALVAQDFLNAQHIHGYKYALNRIEDIKIYTKPNGDMTYVLEVELLETDCHVLDPTPLENCTVRPKILTAIEGDCDVVLKKAGGALTVTAFKCKTDESTEDLCLGCATLLPLNDTTALDFVHASLGTLNKITPDTKFAILEVGRMSSQTLGICAARGFSTDHTVDCKMFAALNQESQLKWYLKPLQWLLLIQLQMLEHSQNPQPLALEEGEQSLSHCQTQNMPLKEGIVAQDRVKSSSWLFGLWLRVEKVGIEGLLYLATSCFGLRRPRTSSWLFELWLRVVGEGKGGLQYSVPSGFMLWRPWSSSWLFGLWLRVEKVGIEGLLYLATSGFGLRRPRTSSWLFELWLRVVSEGKGGLQYSVPSGFMLWRPWSSSWLFGVWLRVEKVGIEGLLYLATSGFGLRRPWTSSWLFGLWPRVEGEGIEGLLYLAQSGFRLWRP